MYLAILAVVLLLAAHSTVVHLQAMLDASCLEPWLTANFDTQSGFQVFGKFVSPSNRSFLSVARQYAASIHKVIPHFDYQGQSRMVIAIYELRVENDGPVVLQE